MADDLVERAQARVGRVLAGKYTLERLIGVGGMAAVYAARHRNGARSAVKVLHPAIAKDENIRARFRNEGYAANKVGHPGAVRVLDDDVVPVGAEGDDAGTVYLVMELLEGESVHVRARRAGGSLPEDDVLSIAHGVLEVLEAAHGQGIVHRDLKPDNLFLSEEEGRSRVKVLDFGVARIADGAARTTAVGTTLGTPSYMAPEQARGQRDLVDGRSDLFALGATMFRLLTNRRIHEGDAAADVLGKVATIQAPPLRSVAPSVSPAIAAIVDRALRFERDERYPHARAMLDDVIAARSGAVVVGLPSGSAPGDAIAPLTFVGGSEPTYAPSTVAHARIVGEETFADPLPPTLQATVQPPAHAPMAATLVATELPATIERGGAVGAPAPAVAPADRPRAAPAGSRKLLAVGLSLAGLLAIVVAVAFVASRDRRPSVRVEPSANEHEEDLVAEPEEHEGEAEPQVGSGDGQEGDDPAAPPTPTTSGVAATGGAAVGASGGANTGVAAPVAAPKAPSKKSGKQPKKPPPKTKKSKGK